MKKYLERKNREATQKCLDESENNSQLLADTPTMVNTDNVDAMKPLAPSTAAATDDSEDLNNQSKPESNRSKVSMFAKFRASRDAKAQNKRPPSTNDLRTDPDEQRQSDERPAFQSAIYGQATSSKKVEPRAVAIPYSRIKKDRFYDWPPDPTVSRATPIEIYRETMEDIDSLTASVPGVLIPDQEDDFPETIRRRNVPDIPIPTSITF